MLGAGPVGLEAALYARFLGYDVVVYERGELAASVPAQGEVRMSSPFGSNRTTLGVAAIEAQDEAYRPPGDEEVLTGKEWIERYLMPLAASDLVSDHLRLHETIIAVGKEEQAADDTQETDEDGEWLFRVRSRNDQGEEHDEFFDGVLDCTGVTGNFDIELLRSEPNYFVLGQKSRGQSGDMPMVEAHDQIRDVFKIIGGREGLDLYVSARRLVK